VLIRSLRWLPPQNIGEHGKNVFLLNTRKMNLNYICMVITCRWLFTR
jgi:hypothetical protein